MIKVFITIIWGNISFIEMFAEIFSAEVSKLQLTLKWFSRNREFSKILIIVEYRGGGYVVFIVCHWFLSV